MNDYSSLLVSVLKQILPTYNEFTLTAKTKTPCISYMLNNNYEIAIGDTMGYSAISYTVKIWGHDLAMLNEYCAEIDRRLKPIGFKRNGTNMLSDKNSTMIQIIMDYEALASENY